MLQSEGLWRGLDRPTTAEGCFLRFTIDEHSLDVRLHPLRNPKSLKSIYSLDAAHARRIDIVDYHYNN